MRSSLRILFLSLLVAWPTASAIAESAPLVVEGTGSATKRGIGQFSATLPDGAACSATFSGGKISLLGQSEAKGVGTCTKDGIATPIRAVVSRRLNGSPREATLIFNDGTRVLVEIPRQAANNTPAAQDPAPGATDTSAPPLPDASDLNEDLVAPVAR